VKYGWEIAEEVQTFVGNSADMQFVPASALDEERLKWDCLTTAQRMIIEKLKAWMECHQPGLFEEILSGTHQRNTGRGESK